jgi:hypothetical protein
MNGKKKLSGSKAKQNENSVNKRIVGLVITGGSKMVEQRNATQNGFFGKRNTNKFKQANSELMSLSSQPAALQSRGQLQKLTRKEEGGKQILVSRDSNLGFLF